ncbi:MAG: hypothetical protein ACE5K8_01295 [Candidatus Zixiibacteriota bacterium]
MKKTTKQLPDEVISLPSSCNRLGRWAALLFVVVLHGGRTWAGDDAPGSLLAALEGIKFGVLAYVDYSNGQMPLEDNAEVDFNRFTLTRGYFTVKKRMNSWLGMRATIDLHQDNTGDYKVRQKYFYAKLTPGDFGPFTDLVSEIGIGHIPWLDFEEHINPYRCQGTMAIERAGVFNSADVGVSLRGNFGTRLEAAKERTGNSHYNGRYGSWHLGVYNGGGYHASETNENKVGEARLTVRPLPDILPGLQLSYLGMFGKGNTESSPDYIVNLAMLSFEHPTVVLTAQYFQTEGNAKGQWVDSASAAVLKTRGYSAFGNIVIPGTNHRLSAFGRYDFFDSDVDNLIADRTAYSMVVAGFAYDLYKGNLILLTVEVTDYEADAAGKGKLPAPGTKLGNDRRIQAVYQIKF